MPPVLPLSVVVATRDTRELTLAALGAVVASSPPDAEILVVDDGGGDGTVEAVRAAWPGVRTLRLEESVGFAAAVNRGVAAARGGLLLLLNSDTEVDPGALEALQEAFAARPRLGIAGAVLRYPDGRPQWSGGAEPSGWWLLALASGSARLLGRLPGWRRLRPPSGVAAGPVHWVTGAAMAVRREVWRQVGPFDEGYLFYCQDLALCSAARAAGWEVAVAPGCTVMHHHGATITGREGATAGRPELLWADLVRYLERHRGESAARRGARLLRLGGRLRLAARTLARPFLPPGRRDGWRRDSDAYRRALAALSAPARR